MDIEVKIMARFFKWLSETLFGRDELLTEAERKTAWLCIKNNAETKGEK